MKKVLTYSVQYAIIITESELIKMSRNYKKENEWKKNKYTTIRADIDKQLGDDLKERLKSNKKTIASWITENAKHYLEKK